MGGVVYAGNTTNTDLLSKYSTRFPVAAGAVIPPGQYFISGAASLVAAGGNIALPAGGYVDSDGKNVTMTAAGHVVALGARQAPVWPWSLPWPLNILT